MDRQEDLAANRQGITRKRAQGVHHASIGAVLDRNHGKSSMPLYHFLECGFDRRDRRQIDSHPEMFDGGEMAVTEHRTERRDAFVGCRQPSANAGGMPPPSHQHVGGQTVLRGQSSQVVRPHRNIRIGSGGRIETATQFQSLSQQYDHAAVDFGQRIAPAVGCLLAWLH